MGKKVKKAFKKVTKGVSKIAKKAVELDPVASAVTGKGGQKEAPEVAPPVQQAAPQLQQAPTNEVAKADAEENTDEDTEAAKRAARARGKQGLSVARSGGTGLNI